MRYDRGLYFKSAPEIANHFNGRPDVLENTLKIADEIGARGRGHRHRAGGALAPGVGDPAATGRRRG